MTGQNVAKIKYRFMGGRWKYELLTDYWFNTPVAGHDISNPFLCLTPAGVLLLAKGYAWNGPSGPAIDTKNFMRGSLCHDGLYECGNLGLPEKPWRDMADLLLVEITSADGMSAIRCRWVLWGVRTFARRAWVKRVKPIEVLEAP
jgi:hypothetical protein